MKKTIAMLLCSTLIISHLISLFFSFGNSNTLLHGNIYRVREIPELRTTNSDTYLLSNGNYECVIYSEDKYYEDNNKSLLQIDNSIVPNTFKGNDTVYNYSNKANASKIYFSENYPNVLIQNGGSSLSFSLVGAQKTTALLGVKSNIESFKDFELNPNNSISYSDVYPSTNFIYTCKSNCLKEYIIVSGPDAPNKFLFSFNAPRYCFKEENNTINIYTEEGELSFTLSSLFAIDSNGAYTDKVYYEILDNSEGNIVIGISIDPDFLTDAQRSFPILIDPSIIINNPSSTQDSYVSSKYPNSNYDSYTQLRTGKNTDYNICRTYIKFIIPASVSPHIASAKIWLKKSNGVTPIIKAYRVTSNWSSSSITWNNKPGYTAVNNSGTANSESNDWYSLEITKLVSMWKKGLAYNYGVLISDVNESNSSHWTAFYSSNTLYTSKPELRIVYMPFDSTLIALKEHDSSGHIYPRSDFFTDVAAYVSIYRNGNTYTSFEYNYNNSEIIAKMQSTLLFYIHTHGTRTEIELGNGTCLTITNMNGIDLSNIKCIVLLTCNNGLGGYSVTRVRNNAPANMVERLIICGAQTVIGFNAVTKISDCNAFAKDFSYRTMACGDTICEAIANIDCSDYINIITSNAVIGGDENQTLN